MKKIFLMSAAISLYGVASASDTGVSCDDMNGFNFGFEIGASVASSQIDTEDTIGASQNLSSFEKNNGVITIAPQPAMTPANYKAQMQTSSTATYDSIKTVKDAETARKEKTLATSLANAYTASHTKYSKKSQNSIKGNLGVNVAYGLNENTAVGLHLGIAAGAKTRNIAQRASDLAMTGYTTEVSELGGVSFEALFTLQQKLPNGMSVLAGAGINIAEIKSQVEMYLDQFRKYITISAKNKKPAAKIMLGLKKPITPTSSMVYKLAYTFGKKKTSQLDTQRVSADGTAIYAVSGGNVVDHDTDGATFEPMTVKNALNCIIDPCQHKMKTKGAFDFTIAYEVNLH